MIESRAKRGTFMAGQFVPAFHVILWALAAQNLSLPLGKQRSSSPSPFSPSQYPVSVSVVPSYPYTYRDVRLHDDAGLFLHVNQNAGLVCFLACCL